MATNPQRIAKGMSKGSKKGNVSHARIIPTKIKHPNTITPIPAKTNTKRIAARKRAINATTSPAAPIAPFSGPVTCCPLIMIVTALLGLKVHAESRSRIRGTEAENKPVSHRQSFLVERYHNFAVAVEHQKGSSPLCRDAERHCAPRRQKDRFKSIE
jgi:hypothetical protein